MSVKPGTHHKFAEFHRDEIPKDNATEKTPYRYWIFVTLLLFFDTMATYYYKTITGAGFSVSILILAAFLFGIFKYGYPKITYPAYVYFGLYFLILMFSVSIISLDEFEITRFKNLVGAIMGFAIGYACFRSVPSAASLRWAFFLISAAYAVVCTIAVLKIYPSLFPVIENLGMRDGKWFARPEVTTDQNYQIFYLFPAVLLLALRNSMLQLFGIFCIAVISVYALGQLQTRSGALVLGGAMVMSAIVGMRSRGKIDFRLVFVVFLGFLLMIVFMDKILVYGELLVKRFTVDDFDTLDNRTDAFLFTLKKLFDPQWWVPQGYRNYHAETRRWLPHSNITAFYVEAGLLGLIGWILAFIIPLVALGKRWFRGVTDDVANLALCGGVAAMIIQLSLNAPLKEHVWFWGGAVVAALARTNAERQMKSTPFRRSWTPRPKPTIQGNPTLAKRRLAYGPSGRQLKSSAPPNKTKER